MTWVAGTIIDVVVAFLTIPSCLTGATKHIYLIFTDSTILTRVALTFIDVFIAVISSPTCLT